MNKHAEFTKKKKNNEKTQRKLNIYIFCKYKDLFQKRLTEKWTESLRNKKETSVLDPVFGR